MRRLLRAAFVPMILAALVCPAQALIFELNEEEKATLNAEAVEAYEDALQSMDKIDYRGALNDFRRAADLDPNHREIRFLVAKLAEYEARKERGEDAVELLRIAETACQEIVDMGLEKARRSEIRRAQTKINQIQRRTSEQAERDARAEKIGRDIVTAIQKEINGGEDDKDDSSSDDEE